MQAMEGLSIEFVKQEDIVKTGLSPAEARDFHEQLRFILSEVGQSMPKIWQKISQGLLQPKHPHPLHQLMYYSTYRTWDTATQGPPPAWIPTPEIARETNIGRILENRGFELLGQKYRNPIDSFPDFHRFSHEHPERYLPMIFNEQSIVFHQQPRCVLDTSNEDLPGGDWLPGAVLNSAECCLAAKGQKTDSSTAIVYRNEGEDDLHVRRVTFAQLRADVSRVTNALVALGFQKGDAIAIDMPMNVHAVTAYLAIILGGFVAVTIPDSFVAKEIAIRIRLTDAKAIFTQDVIFRGGKKLPLYSRVVGARSPCAIIIPANGKTSSLMLRKGDMLWGDFVAQADHLSRPDEYEVVAQPVATFITILFSSGTTGEPKAIPWTHLTALRCGLDGWAHLDLKPGDVISWPTNLGWMVGPMTVFAAFLNGATLALYNGSPLGEGFGKFIQDAEVTMLGTVPSLVKTWKSSGCMAYLDWSAIRNFTSTGEASTVDDDLWLSGRGGYRPVFECTGGTEIVLYASGTLNQTQALAAFSTPSMTMNFVILDEERNPYPDEVTCTGEIGILPLACGSSFTLLNADHHKIYYKGMPYINGRPVRRHGDIFQRLPGGFYKAHGRADDTMNLGGIKASAVEIEQVCNKAHDCVQEAAAVAVQPPGGGPEELVIAVVLKQGTKVETMELRKIFSSSVTSNLNPLFKVRAVAVFPEFPRTASNKLLRRVLRVECAKILYPPLQARL